MKKQLGIIAVTALMSATSFASGIKAGNMEANGSLGMSYTSSDITLGTVTYEQSSFQNEVSALVYITDSVGIGISGVSNVETFTFEGDEEKEITTLLGPAIGIAFPISEKLAFKVQGSYLFGGSTYEENGLVTDTVDATGYGLNFALSIFDGDSISVDPFFSMGSVTMTDDFGNQLETSLTSFGFGVSIYAPFFNK